MPKLLTLDTLTIELIEIRPSGKPAPDQWNIEVWYSMNNGATPVTPVRAHSDGTAGLNPGAKAALTGLMNALLAGVIAKENI